MFKFSCPNRLRVKALNETLELEDRVREVLPELADSNALERSITITETVETSIEMAKEYTCRRCAGIVIDLSNGYAYCGRETPLEVIENNDLIQHN
jgi:hypothetical protein